MIDLVIDIHISWTPNLRKPIFGRLPQERNQLLVNGESTYPIMLKVGIFVFIFAIFKESSKKSPIRKGSRGRYNTSYY